MASAPLEASLVFLGVSQDGEEILVSIGVPPVGHAPNQHAHSIRFGSHGEAADYFRQIADKIEQQGP